MIISLEIILLLLITMFSIVDWRFKQIPSVFLTGTLFMIMMLKFFEHSPMPTFHIATGLIMFVFAWMLYEADFIGGIADVKIITMIGLMLNSYLMIFVSIILILIYGIAYKIIFRFVLKKKPNELIPFVPCLLAVYISTMLWQWGIF